MLLARVHCFVKDFRVRKKAIKKWLYYLRANYLAYYPNVLVISTKDLEALPNNAFVDDDVVIYKINEEAAAAVAEDVNESLDSNNLAVFKDNNPTPKVASVLDLYAENNELANL
ncbi:hypothetical protein CC86DRAFT_386873 [Ophiobolus disseminans]|uniref:Uncharacterized protein n=1 Tax=Ophiobolus disseminans TaxID=1469910 RepID=A0A6A6ZI75_9PLEO|nr:hypothetical protein CC86DRAFT_386873 [Ophiobolus disseminans]